VLLLFLHTTTSNRWITWNSITLRSNLWEFPLIAPRALGIGYAPKGMMKGYVAIPIRLPTGGLTG
jgi:hypothetical protein